ncbi:hypothetical protein [Paenibacillus arenilitoris]|uniref:Uncharacterized protein n=1 Tax=Paenibacillus arenilitoris TaxID=2772299 RepID=A0A927CV54_9BACL|nr:hypothetical protein [Paenibacillus arenilitoris]MBD2872411.1 hypothetical protein [Paenibacillus arenilitoris]
MVQGWVTVLVLAFGIAVAVIGVVAYLKMFRKGRSAPETRPKADGSPPHPSYAAGNQENGYQSEPRSEQASPRD